MIHTIAHTGITVIEKKGRKKEKYTGRIKDPSWIVFITLTIVHAVSNVCRNGNQVIYNVSECRNCQSNASHELKLIGTDVAKPVREK